MWDIKQIKRNLEGRGAVIESGIDGLHGFLKWRNEEFAFIFSYGLGWEHLSVSLSKRCPIWEEMCFFKDQFWRPDETAIQYHPKVSNYINIHKYCLHIWRPIGIEIPMPPLAFL